MSNRQWAPTKGLSRRQLVLRIKNLQLTVEGLEEQIGDVKSLDPDLWDKKVYHLSRMYMEATGEDEPPSDFAELANYIKHLKLQINSLFARLKGSA